MLLHNINLINSCYPSAVQIKAGRIAAMGHDAVDDGDLVLDMEGGLAFPGLINSHDHLDFDLFPQFDGHFYQNYVAWGNYIHQHYHQQIQEVLRVPEQLRIAWGIYKNLLSGVTTVVNHGRKIKHQDRLISVIDNYYYLHSIQLEKRWKLRLNNPLRMKYPYVIHIGEGLDTSVIRETELMLRWNLLRKEIIGVHGIALEPAQAKQLKALVWCPDSNYFLFNSTANIKSVRHCTNILFGTDSTVSASWNIWEHLRLALKTGQLNETELYHSVTETPGQVWKLEQGILAEGKPADIVVVKRNASSHALSDWYRSDPEDILLVIHRGEIRLFDEQLYEQLDKRHFPFFNYSKVMLQGSVKYVQGDLCGLINRIRAYYPQAEFPVKAVEYADS